ncbi:maleylpyruvate isomerase family mycothiol-dependent enzyme [Micromonospora sp. DR5-3]|uniref:maleylpyruvate isomerase family mycothiol-dependent enzyme n=1 Tax=unclassified Micromonospora TaxID=2617518 RepID=UPI00210779BB|nr:MULTISPECIES: maleylpyruvate isomerase family mycothiol-dependent enzyme [unclassified Micromonospora]MCW3814303.1 maleylpyruvate isomerase family mycothiol-dependent enzyme [Micromonospora sp. DR5-3]
MEDRLRAAVVAERRELADLLATLPAAQWDSSSLCDGWRVREVVAHMTMPFRTSVGRILIDLVKARGSFDRMADRAARRDAATMPAERLLAALRENTDHPWTPPGGGVAGALSHDVIHGLDITVGLGLDRRVPPERVGLVLAGMRPRNVAYFGVDLTGVSLQATDLDWEYGSGTPLRGLAQDLLLVICGRRLPPGHLDGEPATRFSG